MVSLGNIVHLIARHERGLVLKFYAPSQPSLRRLHPSASSDLRRRSMYQERRGTAGVTGE